MQQSINRRHWMKLVGTAGLGLGFSGCSSPEPPRPGLPRVEVAPDRVIRTTVGLRPHRPSGFVVRAEPLGDKTVVHNYGHGGSGMTLSWGSSHLAMEEALKTEHRTAAVLGCGAVGLATARLLQRYGFSVTIYAKDLPPRTTSNMSAAWFGPGSGAERDKRTPAFMAQFERAARLSYRYYQDLVGDHYGVRWIARYSISEDPPEERAARAAANPIADLTSAATDLDASEHPFPSPYVQRTMGMVFEPAVYLAAMLRDFHLAGGVLEVKTFESIGQLTALPEPVIMNCTGLGAGELFGDKELMPVKGQLTFLVPQPEIDYMVVGGGLYMIPRRDGLALGGTRERGEWSLEPSETERQRVMEGHTRLFGGMG